MKVLLQTFPPQVCQIATAMLGRGRAIDSQLAALRGEIRRAQARTRAQAKAQARAWTLAAPLLRVVVLIYWLADGIVDPAVF